jgi:LmbE family N-acetylglucosaminyl deacetylase
MTKCPADIAMEGLELWVDRCDLTGKGRMGQRIRQRTGFIESANIQSKTPEQQAEIQQAIQAKEQQAKLQEYMQRLQVALVETDLEKKKADIQKVMADIETELENTKIKRAQALATITSQKEKNTMQESTRKPMSG